MIEGLWHDAPEINQIRFKGMEAKLTAILEKQDDKLLNRAAAGAVNQLGTLGTGNHFVEVCLDEAGNVWVMLHSGSRGLGNRMGMHFIEKARKLAKKWFINLPDQDLAYFPEETPEFDDYTEAVSWATAVRPGQSRNHDGERVKCLAQILSRHGDDGRGCERHHNYVAQENHYGANVWVTRRELCALGLATWALSLAVWAPSLSLCAGRAIRRRFIPVRMAPAGL